MGAIETTVGLALGGLSDIANQATVNNNVNQQLGYAQQMALYNKEQQIDLFNRTGYEAQVKQMMNAGLNPALMYKGGGNGGSTNLQTSSANVPFAGTNMIKSMDVASAMAQIEVTKAQANNLEADTVKKEAETEEVEQRTPTYSKGMEKTDQEIKEMASRMNVNEETIKKIIQEVKESESKVNVNESTIGKQSAEKEYIETNTSRMKQLTPLEVQQKEQEIKSMVTKNVYLDAKERQELNNMMVEARTKLQAMRNDNKRVSKEQFIAEIQANYPNLFNVLGKGADNLTDGLKNFFAYIMGTEGNYEVHSIDKKK